MRRAARIDNNHPEIVDALHAVGASTQSLAQVGDGCPDLLVGFRGVNFLLEIKNPDAAGAVNELQRKWHIAWRAPVFTVHNVDEALRALGAAK